MRCELCHQSFLFSPVYAPNAPDILSASEFVVGVVNIVVKKLALVLRIVTVIFLWILFLPVGTTWICRLYFLRSLSDLARFRNRLQLGALVSDWMQGVLLSLLVVAVFLAVSGLRDYILRQELQLQLHEEEQEPQRQPEPFEIDYERAHMGEDVDDGTDQQPAIEPNAHGGVIAAAYEHDTESDGALGHAQQLAQGHPGSCNENWGLEWEVEWEEDEEDETETKLLRLGLNLYDLVDEVDEVDEADEADDDFQRKVDEADEADDDFLRKVGEADEADDDSLLPQQQLQEQEQPAQVDAFCLLTCLCRIRRQGELCFLHKKLPASCMCHTPPCTHTL